MSSPLRSKVTFESSSIMTSKKYVFIMSEKFGEVRKYVKEGLPSDHWSREYDSEPEDGGKKWNDEDDYSKLPPEIRDAARFRDGLVLDGEVYR